MGKNAIGRRWYQNVPVENVTFEDPERKHSKFWNEGKWHTFIEPLLPSSKGTFIEIGCNAGLFLQLASNAGFRNVIGIEANTKIMRQAIHFKNLNNGNYKLLHRRAGWDLDLEGLPLADVILISNVHYYFPIGVFSNLVDQLKSRALLCLIVAAKARRRGGNVVHYLEGIKGYFRDWKRVRTVENIDETDDPVPRRQMYGASFKGNLDVFDIEGLYNRWMKQRQGRSEENHSRILPAIEQFYRQVFKGGESSKGLLFEYWMDKVQDEKWVQNKLKEKMELGKDIQENGLKQPLYYDTRGKLLDGIHRLVIMRELKYKDILVRVL